MLDVSSAKPPQQAHGAEVLRSVFHTLAYADVFDYPLTAAEVYRYLTSSKASLEEVNQILTDDTLFARVGGYFTLHGREAIVETRKRRSGVALRLWAKAARYGQIIAQVPFVRMVAITGSLSMNNTEEGKDVDFMIVTVPGHLWTSRAFSLLVARFAKLEGISLCPNYLVTTHSLELQERSLYVAHELAQMIPLSGMDVYCELRRQNRWTDEFLPNASNAPDLPPGVKPVAKRSFLQGFLEIVLGFLFGKQLETWEMNRKIRKLTHEQSSSIESYFSADVCKGHIDQHGENIVVAFTSRLQKTI